MDKVGEVFQGEHGEYTLTQRDYLEARIQRYGLFLTLACSLIAIFLVSISEDLSDYANILAGLYWLVCLSLAAVLKVIHLYSIIIKFVLRLLLLIGVIISLVVMLTTDNRFILALSEGAGYVGVCFILAVLTGLYIKEATCFEQWDAKALCIMLPLLAAIDVFTSAGETIKIVLLWFWGGLFFSLMVKKNFQPLEYDIGDKSIIEDLEKWWASLKNNTHRD